MSTRYFVSTADDGSVSHLVRVMETETTLVGEFYVDGRWVQDGSAMDFVFDRTLGEEIDAERAEQIVTDLGSSAEPVSLDHQEQGAIRAGLAELLPAGAPALPDPIPPRGRLTGDGWTITYVVGVGGQPGLDVFAEHRLTAPVHAHVDPDGAVVVLDSLQYEYGYDPDAPGDQQAAEERMQAHNRKVRAELTRKQLI